MLADNWEYVAAGVLVIAGVALMFTGIGGAAGIAVMAASGSLVNMGASMITQKLTTGKVNLTQTLTDGLIGAATGGFSAGVAVGVRAISSTRVVGNVFRTVSGAGRTGLQLISNGAKSVGQSLVRVSGKTIELLGSGISRASSAISNGAVKTFNLLASGTVKTVNMVSSGVNRTVSLLGVGATKSANLVTSGAVKTVNAVKTGARSVGQGLVSVTGKTINAINTATTKTITTVHNFITKPSVKEFSVLTVRESTVNVGATYMDALAEDKEVTLLDIGVSVIGGRATSVITDIIPNNRSFWKNAAESGGTFIQNLLTADYGDPYCGWLYKSAFNTGADTAFSKTFDNLMSKASPDPSSLARAVGIDTFSDVFLKYSSGFSVKTLYNEAYEAITENDNNNNGNNNNQENQ